MTEKKRDFGLKKYVYHSHRGIFLYLLDLELFSLANHFLTRKLVTCRWSSYPNRPVVKVFADHQFQLSSTFCFSSLKPTFYKFSRQDLVDLIRSPRGISSTILLSAHFKFVRINPQSLVNLTAFFDSTGDTAPTSSPALHPPTVFPTFRSSPAPKRRSKGSQSNLRRSTGFKSTPRTRAQQTTTHTPSPNYIQQPLSFPLRVDRPQIYLPDDLDPITHPEEHNHQFQNPYQLHSSYPRASKKHRTRPISIMSGFKQRQTAQVSQGDVPTPYAPKIVPSSALMGRIGIVADVQFANVPNAWNFAKTNERAYYRALNILSSANDIFNYVNLSADLATSPSPSTSLSTPTLPKRPCRPVNPGVIFRDETVSLIDKTTSHHGICIRSYDSPTEQSNLISTFYPDQGSDNGNNDADLNRNGVRMELLNQLDTYIFSKNTTNSQIDHVIQLGDFIDGKNASLPIHGIENQDLEQLSIEDLVAQHAKRSAKNLTTNFANNFTKPKPTKPNGDLNTDITLLPYTNDGGDYMSFIPASGKEGVPHQVVVKRIHRDMLALHYYFILKFLQFASTQDEFTKLQAIPLVEQVSMRQDGDAETLSSLPTSPLSPITPNSTPVSPEPFSSSQLTIDVAAAKSSTSTEHNWGTFSLNGPKLPLYYHLEQIRARITPTTFHSFLRSTFPIFSNQKLTPELTPLFASLLTEPPTLPTATALGSVFNAIAKSKQEFWHSLMGNHDLYTISRPILPYIYSTTGRLEDSMVSQVIKKFNHEVDTVLTLPIHQEHDGSASITSSDIDTTKLAVLKKWLREEEEVLNAEIIQLGDKITALFTKTRHQKSIKSIFDVLMDHIDAEIDLVEPHLPELVLPGYITGQVNTKFQPQPIINPTLDSNISLYKTIATHPTHHSAEGISNASNNNVSQSELTTPPPQTESLPHQSQSKPTSSLHPSPLAQQPSHKHTRDSFYDPYNYTHCYHTPINDNYHLIVIDGYRGATSGYPLLHDHFQHPLVNHLAKNNPNLTIPPPSTQYSRDLITNPPRGNWINGLSFEMKRFVPYNGALMSAQLDWLEGILTSPSTIPSHKRIILASHVALSQYHATGTTVLYDGNELLGLLRKHPQRVDMCLFGHDHSGHYMYDATCGTHFVTPAAPIEASHGDVFDPPSEHVISECEDDADGCDPEKAANKLKTPPQSQSSPSQSTTIHPACTTGSKQDLVQHPPSAQLNDPNSAQSKALQQHKSQHRAENVSYSRGYRRQSRKIAYNQDPNLVGLNNGNTDVFDDAKLNKTNATSNTPRLFNNDFIHAAAVIELYQDEVQIVGFGNVVSRYLKFGPKQSFEAPQDTVATSEQKL